MPDDARLPLRERWSRLTRAYARWVEPRPDGLPRVRVLLSFPLLVLLGGALLIGLSVNGTSSGSYYSSFESGEDPALVAGSPLPIRSDEWNVWTPWAIGQIEQGLPDTNETFPGGMDAAIPQDLPRADWSVALRPHLIGYLFLDADHAFAFKWWAPPMLLMAFAFMFAVTVLPRRPLVAAMLSVGFYFSPFFQWWMQSVSFFPTAWALAAMAALIWAVKARTRLASWIWAVAVAYLTAVMAMSIYAPYIVPVVIVTALFGVGLLVRALRDRPRWSTLLAFVPIGVAGVAGAAVSLVWLKSEQTTVDAFLDTDYPGQRFVSTGAGDALLLARTIASPFSEALKRNNGFLGINASEASTYFLLGAFLIPVAIWIAVRLRRRGDRLPWELLGLMAAIVLFIAYAFLPGWDAISHLLFLDRSTPTRIRIGLGLAAFAMAPLIMAELSKQHRPGRGFTLGTVALFLLPQLGIAVALVVHGGFAELTDLAPFWWLWTAASCASIYLVARARPGWGAFAYLVVNVAATITVNPVYLGVFDLRETRAGEAIEAVDEREPGSWVGVGSILTSALLVESGVRAYNGTQGAPSLEMWEQIDPDGDYTPMWNRLGGVNWVPGEGDPTISNPSPDLIIVTFDACAGFAQRNVDYVVTDGEVNESCLREIDEVPLTNTSLRIFEVIPAR